MHSRPTKPRDTSAFAGRGPVKGGTKAGWIGLLVLAGAAVALFVMDSSRTNDTANQARSFNLNNNESNQNQAGANLDLSTPPRTTADLPQTQADCQSAEGDWTWSNSACVPADQMTCEKYDGLWGPIGQSIPEGCSLLADDSGRDCQDSAECAGHCLLIDATGPGAASRDDELADVTGQCSERTLIKGCYVEVTRGLAGVKCL